MKRLSKKLAICITLILTLLINTTSVFAASEKQQTNVNDLQKLEEKLITQLRSSTKASILKDGQFTSPKQVTAMFQSGGSDHTHQYIVSSALAILENDMGTSVLNDLSNQSTLLTYTDWPDIAGNETDYLTFAGHFYDPDTGKNWLGKTSPTAKSRATNYYNLAVNSYNAGNISEALVYLGKGTHYVSDINEPHHAANLTALNSNHSEFEEYVDINRTSYTIDGNTLSSSIYLTAQSETVSTMMQNAAINAKALSTAARQEELYDVTGKQCVQNAITCMAQYIFKFGLEVGIY